MLFTTKQTSLLKYSAKLAPNNILRVPVVSKEGKPLMPTKASRARKWIKSGKAVKRWSKTGLFYIQLQVEPSDTKLQEVVLALDPGSKQVFDGITITTQKEVQLQSMLILRTCITKKLEDRRRLRRARRFRSVATMK